MELRKTLNRRPKIAAFAGVGMLVIAGAVLMVWASTRVAPGTRAARAYYTDDEGKTFFADSIERVYPFDHHGRQAYRAFVYQCGDGGQPFVSYIARHTDAAAARLAELKGKEGDADVAAEVMQLRNTAVEVRRTGDAQWVSLFSDAGEAIAQHPLCPDGKKAKFITPPNSGGAQGPTPAGPPPPLPALPATAPTTATAASAEQLSADRPAE